MRCLERGGENEMQPPMKNKYANDFQTPPTAIVPLLKFIPKKWVIWECAEGKGNLTKFLRESGYKVIGTDIKNGFDFLWYLPEEKFDCIITNPPYSLKQQFLERCYSIGKPFGLLMPLTTLETEKRQKLFARYGLKILFLKNRVNFETPSGKGSGSWFASAWFTWQIPLPKSLYWEISEAEITFDK